jgi:hypothetical protein
LDKERRYQQVADAVARSKSKLGFLFESAATSETIGRYSFVGTGQHTKLEMEA